MKPVLIVSAILGILGIPAGAYFVFSDRQIEVEYGTKTFCYKCKKVEKAPHKKIIWASKRYNYEVKIKESCCEKCKVEVETGSISTCAVCDKTLASEVKKIKIDPRENHEGFAVHKTSRDYCDSCKPKPQVLWGTFTNDWGNKTFAPACPGCRNKVQVGSTRCRCGQEFQWVNGTCTNCKGFGYQRCSNCNFTGKDNRKCGWCGGKGTYMGAALGNDVKCRDCKGTGKTSHNCMWCSGNKKTECRWCDGQGIIGGTRKPWPH
ncbi:MAG: hypothetical protein WAP74_02840 [Patescibacteria group bacterium]